nr:MAG TPA: hypothetical protein [Caudoviricetes sp.]
MPNITCSPSKQSAPAVPAAGAFLSAEQNYQKLNQPLY